MSKPRPRKKGNPDLRRRTNQPGVEIPEITKELFELLEPKMFTPLKYLQGNHEKIMRDRLLSLPVMVALVVSLVYRQIAGLSEAVRLLEEEGLLWVKPLKVTRQAVSKRIMNVPAEIFAILLKKVLEKAAEKAEKIQVGEKWEKVREKFSAVWIADGSTLEQIRKRMKISKEEKSKLGGKMMMVVEAFTQRPVTLWYTENDKSNDKIWCEELAAKLPENGLMLVDMGFFSFVWFDLLTEAKKFFLTRFRAGTSYKTKQVLSQGSHYRDEIIMMGNYRSNPCKYPVRLVSVLWGTTWYQYLTNVLSPEQLSAEEVCDLYRRRWTIEEAFLLTKRLLGLAYLWVGNKNGVQIQIICTLIFYTVLNQLVGEVAIALNQPKEKISVEMVFRGLYHVARAIARGEKPDTVTFLAERAKSFGLVKAERKRHQEKAALNRQIWDPLPLS